MDLYTQECLAPDSCGLNLAYMGFMHKPYADFRVGHIVLGGRASDDNLMRRDMVDESFGALCVYAIYVYLPFSLSMRSIGQETAVRRRRICCGLSSTSHPSSGFSVRLANSVYSTHIRCYRVFYGLYSNLRTSIIQKNPTTYGSGPHHSSLVGIAFATALYVFVLLV